jgi:transposase InsO family protein
METSLVTGALEMALRRRQLDGELLHHTDRGSQYASTDYRNRLEAQGIICSMSRKGNWRYWQELWNRADQAATFSSC